MKRLRECLRSTVISFEFALILVFTYLGFFHPNVAYTIDAIFSKEPEKLKWLALIPCGILVWTVSLVRKIRFPEKDKKSMLQKWDGYWDLCLVTHIAVFYAFMFTCAGAFTWVGVGLSASKLQGFILLGSVLGSIIVGFSCFLAEMTINDEFSREG